MKDMLKKLAFLTKPRFSGRPRLALILLFAAALVLLGYAVFRNFRAFRKESSQSFWQTLSLQNRLKKYESTLLGLGIDYPDYFSASEEDSSVTFFSRGKKFCTICRQKRKTSETASQIATRRLETFYFNAERKGSAAETKLVCEKRLSINSIPASLYQFVYRVGQKEYLLTECVIVTERSLLLIDFWHSHDDIDASLLREGMLNSIHLLPVPENAE